MCGCERDCLTFRKVIPRHCRHLIHFLFCLHCLGNSGTAKLLSAMLFRHILALFKCFYKSLDGGRRQGKVVSPGQQWPCSKSLGMNNSLITSLPITVSLQCVPKGAKKRRRWVLTHRNVSWPSFNILKWSKLLTLWWTVMQMCFLFFCCHSEVIRQV